MKKLALYLTLGCVACSLIIFGCNGSSTGTSSTGPAGSSGGAGITGAVKIDGSTTVYPIVSILGEDFKAENSGVEMEVNKSGTGSGFKKFIAGEMDIATASRPISDKEDADLKAKGVEYVEVPIAFDGLSVIVNPQNTWITDTTIEELQKMWAPGSTVKMWSDVNPAWPKEEINFHGPTDNHGTYEYFTEAVVGKKNEIRDGYQPDQEYNSIVNAVAGNKNAIGYVGFNYYDENKSQVNALKVNGVAPSAQSIEDGTYTPLSRPLFIYVRKDALETKPQVKAFVEYALNGGLDAVTEAKYVKLPADVYEMIRKNVSEMKTGSAFMGVEPGLKIQDVLAREQSDKK